MKRILMSLLVVGVVASSVVAATQAVFSATGNINGNTIATAQIVFTAQGEANATTLAKPLIASGLIPGQWTSWARGTLYNHTGSTPVRAYMYVANVSGAACDKVVLRVTTGFAGSDANERARDVYNNWLTSLQGSANRVETTGIPPFATIGVIVSQVLQQQAQLHPTADDSYQNKTCTWDEVFVAETPTI